MTVPNLLLVSNLDSRLIENDRVGLEKLGRVTFMKYTRRTDILKLVRTVLRSDLIVCWFVLGYATASVLLGRMFSIPCVLIAGGWDVSAEADLGYGAMLGSRRAWKTRFALRHATRVIAVSEETKRQVGRWVSSDIDVIHNGVDTDFFSPLNGRARQVVTVAGVDSEVRFRVKGVDVFLETARRMSDVSFLLVGGNTRGWDQTIRQVASANVRILGHLEVDKLREVYRSSQVYAQLSARESFGVALAEAMACGCVPVVSSRGALTEVVGTAGYVVQYGDVASTVEAINRALEDKQRGRQARERIATEFSLQQRRTDLINTLRPLIDRGG